jgi:mRNA interferase MazF
VPGNVLLRKGTANLPKAGVAVVTQMATVDKHRLLEKVGTLAKDTLEEVIKGCQMVISLTLF